MSLYLQVVMVAPAISLVGDEIGGFRHVAAALSRAANS